MTAGRILFGLSLTTANPLNADPRRSLRDLVERVEAAREAGFHSIWVGDHHVTAGVHYFQNIPTIARVAAHSGAMRVGMFCMPPLFPPVLLAEQIATLDAVAEGRFTLMAGVGGQREAHAAFGIPWKERAGRFEESLHIMRRLWNEDHVSYEGRYYRFSDVTINPKPVQRPLPVWIGGDTDGALQRAARLGAPWIAAPWMPAPVLEERAAFYRQALARCGTAEAVSEFPIRRDVYVAADPETARRHAEAYVPSYRGFTAEAKTALLIGTPQEMIDQVERYHRSTGCNHFLLRHIVGEQDRRLASIRLIGAQVIPHFAR